MTETKAQKTERLQREKVEYEINEWRQWVDAQRAKRRIMTWGEYMAWRLGGDSISSPSEGNPFPGGLTILLNIPPIIGRVKETD